MEITDARYSDENGRWIICQMNGREAHVPVDHYNTNYRLILSMGVPIAPYQPPPPTVDDVRSECSRRMQAMVGARDEKNLEHIISNAGREATRLQAIRLGVPGVVEGREWTADEAQRAAALFMANEALDAIRAASNVLEAMDPIPADYAQDRWWGV